MSYPIQPAASARNTTDRKYITGSISRKISCPEIAELDGKDCFTSAYLAGHPDGERLTYDAPEGDRIFQPITIALAYTADPDTRRPRPVGKRRYLGFTPDTPADDGHPSFFKPFRFGLTEGRCHEQLVAILDHARVNSFALLINGDFLDDRATTPQAIPRRLVPKPGVEPTFARAKTRLVIFDFDALDPVAVMGSPPSADDMLDRAYLETIVRRTLAGGLYGDALADVALVVGASSSHGLTGKVKLRAFAFLDTPLAPKQIELLLTGTGSDPATTRHAHQVYVNTSRHIFGRDDDGVVFEAPDPFATVRVWHAPGLRRFIPVPQAVADMTDADARLALDAISAAAHAAREAGAHVFEHARPGETGTRSIRAAGVTQRLEGDDFAERVESLTAEHGVHASVYALARTGFAELGPRHGIAKAERLIVRAIQSRLRELQAEADPTRAVVLGERIGDVPRRVGEARDDYRQALERQAPDRPAPMALPDAEAMMAQFMEAVGAAVECRASLFEFASTLVLCRHLMPADVNALSSTIGPALDHTRTPVTLKAPAGLGKTHALVRLIADLVACFGDRLRVAIVVPNHGLAEEIATELKALSVSVHVHQGMDRPGADGGTMCSIWGEPLVQDARAAKAPDLCLKCPRRAACAYLAQPQASVTIFAGLGTLARPVPDMYRRPGRDLSIAALRRAAWSNHRVHDLAGLLPDGASDDDAEMGLALAGNAHEFIRQGDFDLVVVDESEFHTFTVGDDVETFRLADVDAPLAVPAGLVYGEDQTDALAKVQAWRATVARGLRTLAAEGVEADVDLDPVAASGIPGLCRSAYMKPTAAHVREIVEGRAGPETRRLVRKCLAANRMLDKVANLARAIAGEGSFALRPLRTDAAGRSEVDLHEGEPGAPREAVVFAARGRVHSDWQQAPLVISDATLRWPIVKAVLDPSGDRGLWFVEIAVDDPTVIVHGDSGPVHGDLKAVGDKTADDVAASVRAFEAKAERFLASRRLVTAGERRFGAVALKGLASTALRERYGGVLTLGALRGSNALKGLDELHVFGRINPGSFTIKFGAAVVHGVPFEAFDGSIGLHEHPVRVRRADGSIEHEPRLVLAYRDAAGDRDDRVEDLIGAFVLDELVQAFARLRGIRSASPKTVFAFTQTHVPDVVYGERKISLDDYAESEGELKDRRRGKVAARAALLRYRAEGRRFETRRAVYETLRADDALDGSIKSFEDHARRDELEGLDLSTWIDRHLLTSRRRTLGEWIAEAVRDHGCTLEKGGEAKRLKATVLRLMAEAGEAEPEDKAWKMAVLRTRARA